MKKFIIKFHVWIDNQLSLSYIKLSGKSKKEVEERFWREKHIMPVSIEEVK